MTDQPEPQPFAAQLMELDVSLPLAPHSSEIGVVVDAEGRAVFTVDVNRERPDGDVFQIAGAIAVAVSTRYNPVFAPFPALARTRIAGRTPAAVQPPPSPARTAAGQHSPRWFVGDLESFEEVRRTVYEGDDFRHDTVAVFRTPQEAHLAAAAPAMLAALRKAESFISGFEGDPLQEGVDDLISGIRAAVANVDAVPA